MWPLSLLAAGGPERGLKRSGSDSESESESVGPMTRSLPQVGLRPRVRRPGQVMGTDPQRCTV
jgi:hypothetical protein